jgi:iron(III) transport system substrate-binding protein
MSSPFERRGFLRLGLGALSAGAFDVLGRSPAAASPPAQDESEERLYAEAKKEGKVVWWTSHYAMTAAEGVRDAFVAKYPGIEVQFIRQTAQVVYQRLAEGIRR